MLNARRAAVSPVGVELLSCPAPLLLTFLDRPWTVRDVDQLRHGIARPIGQDAEALRRDAELRREVPELPDVAQHLRSALELREGRLGGVEPRGRLLLRQALTLAVPADDLTDVRPVRRRRHGLRHVQPPLSRRDLGHNRHLLDPSCQGRKWMARGMAVRRNILAAVLRPGLCRVSAGATGRQASSGARRAHVSSSAFIASTTARRFVKLLSASHA